MTSAFGLQVFNGAGSLVAGSDLQGTIYLGTYTATAGSGATYTFPTVPAGSLLAFLSSRGSHTFATGDDGSGNAQLTFTAATANTPKDTSVQAFATATNEPSYGISTLNAAGTRMLSALYPTPQFLGKVTFSTTPSSSYTGPTGSVTVTTYQTTTTVGHGRNTLIMWNLPSWTGTWMKYLGTFPGGSTDTIAIETVGTLPTVMPEALVFAVDGLSASSDSFGVRVYDASGNVTFDSGLDHLATSGVEASLSYGFSYTSAFLPGCAISLPDYYQEIWSAVVGDPSSSNQRVKEGFVRRNGSMLEGALFQTDFQTEEAPVHGTFSQGVLNDAPVRFASATVYGGTNFS